MNLQHRQMWDLYAQGGSLVDLEAAGNLQDPATYAPHRLSGIPGTDPTKDPYFFDDPELHQPLKDKFKVYMSSLGVKVNAWNLRDQMAVKCGKVIQIKFLWKKGGGWLGVAFVSFDNEASVNLALTLNGTKFMGSPKIAVRSAIDKKKVEAEQKAAEEAAAAKREGSEMIEEALTCRTLSFCSKAKPYWKAY